MNFLFLIVGVILGGLGGYMVNPQRLKELREDMHIIKSIVRHKQKVGTIHRPSADNLRERGTFIEETKNAMRQTLQNDPYLNENN